MRVLDAVFQYINERFGRPFEITDKETLSSPLMETAWSLISNGINTGSNAFCISLLTNT